MPRRSTTGSATRAGARLSRESIVSAAVDLADREGLAALSMRRLAQQLGVDAMSIYYHLPDKKALLIAMADAVVAEIEPEPPDGDAWTGQLRELIMVARATMARHPWAARILEQRNDPSPAVMRHIERVLAVMRRGGCSVGLGHHALHLLGSRILGFSQDLFDDSPASQPSPEVLAAQAAQWAATLPHIAELATAVSHDGPLGGCDDDDEFAFALDILLDGLERRRRAEDRA
ncbi:TetR/AcrR family transcriptional regulator [Mangrovihabitans endophyticus]|uniref:TetR family transcriptional regulator n=1 Tax=Mangrovihabitans endophyticus TaxID=1751298 RepID=A0A8J3FLA2_9ACTN|nr:TetR/AcrR family transcriptional regulator [Mangrovihabitans endophyticus]GGK75382.1 TetR family transcriptional regulator [Mangrovihabitans endophyticus]